MRSAPVKPSMAGAAKGCRVSLPPFFCAASTPLMSCKRRRNSSVSAKNLSGLTSTKGLCWLLRASSSCRLSILSSSTRNSPSTSNQWPPPSLTDMQNSSKPRTWPTLNFSPLSHSSSTCSAAIKGRSSSSSYRQVSVSSRFQVPLLGRVFFRMGTFSRREAKFWPPISGHGWWPRACHSRRP